MFTICVSLEMRFPSWILESSVVLFLSSVMLEDSQDGMDSGSLTPGSARQVCIQRHPSHGFGFIAGSERPVVVRSVSAGKTRLCGPDVYCPLTVLCQPISFISF